MIKVLYNFKYNTINILYTALGTYYKIALSNTNQKQHLRNISKVKVSKKKQSLKTIHLFF